MDIKKFEGLEDTLKTYVEKASLGALKIKQRSMTADFAHNKEAKEVLAELLGISEDAVKLAESRLSFRRKLYEVLGNNYTGRRLSRQLETEMKAELGAGCTVFEPENAQEVCESLSGFSGGKGPFYIVEEVFFVRFDDVTAVFYVGNDE